MTPATAQLDTATKGSEIIEEPQASIPVSEPSPQPEPSNSEGSDTEAAAKTVESLPETPARLFLDRLGLFQKLSPLIELNKEIQQEAPQFDSLYAVLDSDLELNKRFLKFANAAWFNSRIQIDSPVMAFTRFGTEGFYRLVLATFLQASIGELSTKFKLWPHLEWTARAGEMVAQQLAPKFTDAAFAAGLLHDAVVASMDRELQDYLYFIECALGTDPVVTGLENSCHGFDHAQAAGELARALNFEPSVVEAVAGHHNESMSAVSSADARSVLGLLLTTKRAMALARAHRKNAFETATEKVLLREISSALNVSSGRVISVVADVVETLHLHTA